METAERVNTSPISSSSSAGPSTTSEGSDGSPRAGASPLIARLADLSGDQSWVCRTCNHAFGEIAVHDPQEEVLKVHEEEEIWRANGFRFAHLGRLAKAEHCCQRWKLCVCVFFFLK